LNLQGRVMGWRQHLYQAVLIGLFVTFLVTIR
jgi:hypothetical protein